MRTRERTMADKSVRVSESAADTVARVAEERGITKAQAATLLVEEGWRALATDGSDVRQSLESLMGLSHTDTRGNAYSVAEYAAAKGLTPGEALERLIRVALGREGALARDRAKRPPQRRERQVKASVEAIPHPWAHLEGGE